MAAVADRCRPAPPVSLGDWWPKAEELADLAHMVGMGLHTMLSRLTSELKYILHKDLPGSGG